MDAKEAAGFELWWALLKCEEVSNAQSMEVWGGMRERGERALIAV